MASANAEGIAARSRFALGMAVASLICIFAFSIPLLTYLGEGLFLCVDVPGPKALQLLIRVSPWLPASIAVLGSLGLLMKEARMSPAAALKWNWAAVFAVAVFGGFVLLVCVVAMVQILVGLNGGHLW
jgi:hypothetical protein